MPLSSSLLRPAKRLCISLCSTRSAATELASETALSSKQEPKVGVPYRSDTPWHILSPVTPARGPRALPIRDLTPTQPSARAGAAILPRDPSDSLSNPAATMAKEVLMVQYPYFVNRTSASGALPVYSDKRGTGKSQKLTIIRRIDGDVEALRQDILKDFPNIQSLFNPYNRQIVLKGDYEREMKLWLRDRGF